MVSLLREGEKAQKIYLKCNVSLKLCHSDMFYIVSHKVSVSSVFFSLSVDYIFSFKFILLFYAEVFSSKL